MFQAIEGRHCIVNNYVLADKLMRHIETHGDGNLNK